MEDSLISNSLNLMKFEERLKNAKLEKELTRAPTLRRALLRTRWLGSVGGTFLLISAIRELISSFKLLDDTPVPALIALVSLAISIAVLILSRMSTNAASRRDLHRVARVFGWLKAVLSAYLLMTFCTAIYIIIQLNESGANPAPYLLLALIPAGFVFFWLLDIRTARAEILAIKQTEPGSPDDKERRSPLEVAAIKRRRLIFAAIGSIVCSGVLAGLFWFLATYRYEWLAEHLTGKPLGMVEPFELYSQLADSGDSPPLWDKWAGDLYTKATGLPHPSTVEPDPAPSTDSDQGGPAAPITDSDAAVEAYNLYLNDHPEIYGELNRRIFMIDFAAYLVCFSILSFAAVLILSKHATKNGHAASDPNM